MHTLSTTGAAPSNQHLCHNNTVVSNQHLDTQTHLLEIAGTHTVIYAILPAIVLTAEGKMLFTSVCVKYFKEWVLHITA